MDKKSELFVKIGADILFCAMVVFFFGRNCTLRFAACGALYKEYLVALLPLAVFHLTMFVLFPLLLQRNWRLWYVLALLACSLFAAALELLFVAPQLVPVLKKTLGEGSVFYSFRNYLLLITLRDLAFSAVAHIICESRLQKIMREKYEARLSAVANEVDESSNNPISPFFKADSILFCQQARNVTWVHLDDGRIISRHSSLKKLADLLGTDSLIYVSRDTIVMRDKILSYDDYHIGVGNPDSGLFRFFEWSPSFYEKAIMVLENAPDGEQTSQHGELTCRKPQKVDEVLPEYVKDNRNLRVVYRYIAQHPNCKATDVKTKSHVSQSTVNRILGQLKKEGLIEYQGSKKKGGYFVVERGEEGENKN